MGGGPSAPHFNDSSVLVDEDQPWPVVDLPGVEEEAVGVVDDGEGDAVEVDGVSACFGVVEGVPGDQTSLGSNFPVMKSVTQTDSGLVAVGDIEFEQLSGNWNAAVWLWTD